MEPEFQCCIHNGSIIIPILRPINPTPHNVVLSLCCLLQLDRPRDIFSTGSAIKMSKALLPSSVVAMCPAHFNFLDLINFTIWLNGTNYGVPHSEAFLLPIFITFGPKYSPQDSVFKYS